jgi:DNA primase
MSTKKKKKILVEVLGESQKVGNEYLFYCPYCSHEKKKLSINLNKNKYKCWICEKSGSSISYLIKRFGSTTQYMEWSSFDDSIDMSIDKTLIEDIYKLGKEKKTKTKVSLPKEFISLTGKKLAPTASRAMAYLRGRNLNKNDILAWKIGYCSSGEYAGRIVIPSFDLDGDLSYFIARSYTSEAFPPYNNSNASKDIVFNELFQNIEKEIILVEGVFDAIIAGETAIPLLGSSLRSNTELFNRILEYSPKVYFGLDPDAIKKEDKIIKMFLEYGLEVYKINVEPYQDVGSMTKSVFKRRKDKAERVTMDSFLEYSFDHMEI